jgi:hypothetical protein
VNQELLARVKNLAAQLEVEQHEKAAKHFYTHPVDLVMLELTLSRLYLDRTLATTGRGQGRLGSLRQSGS